MIGIELMVFVGCTIALIVFLTSTRINFRKCEVIEEKLFAIVAADGGQDIKVHMDQSQSKELRYTVDYVDADHHPHHRVFLIPHTASSHSNCLTIVEENESAF